MARHRAPGESAGKRRVASWPIAVLMIVVLVVVAWVGWSWLGDVASKRAAAAANQCHAGLTTIQVATDPTIANIIGQETVRYESTNPQVDSACVKIKVTSINSAAALNAFQHGWDTAKLGPQPQAWIPDSSIWTNQLLAAQPGIAGDTARSIATSPVVLAMPADAAKAIQTTSVRWSQLPGLVAQASGWTSLGQPSWGAITVALPDPSSNAASLLALSAMVNPGSTPITADVANATTVKQALDNFAGTQPNPSATTTQAALATLGKAPGVQSAPYTCVPTTEIELYERNLGKDSLPQAANVLDEVRPDNGTPAVDFPFLPLSGSWANSQQIAVAQAFRDFLRTGAEQRELTQDGLRTAEGFQYPNPSPGMDWGTVTIADAPVDVTSYQQLTGAWNTAITVSH